MSNPVALYYIGPITAEDRQNIRNAKQRVAPEMTCVLREATPEETQEKFVLAFGQWDDLWPGTTFIHVAFGHHATLDDAVGKCLHGDAGWSTVVARVRETLLGEF